MSSLCTLWRRTAKLPLVAFTIVFWLLLSGIANALPRIVTVTPAGFSQLSSVEEITAAVYGVTGEAALALDGVLVPVQLTGDTVSYSTYLKSGVHTAYLKVTDNLGNQAERVWQFTVTDAAKPGLMPDKATCENCHPNTFKNFPGHAVDEVTLPNPWHPHSCNACHDFWDDPSQLIVRKDGSVLISYCTSCHMPHGTSEMYPPPPHGHTEWKGTWSADATVIKAPRESLDCQYCHQPGTKVRLGHDLAVDHKVAEDQCTSCHGEIMTVVHSKAGYTCQSCHNASDPAIKAVAQAPGVAKAGLHSFQTSKPDSVVTVSYNDLNLDSLTITADQSNYQYTSPEWSPGPGLEIKRLKVDGWSINDQQFIFAYVYTEDKWYSLSVADEGKVTYGKYPADSKARELYMPEGTTKVKTVVLTGSGTFSGINVREVYYNKPAKCTDCHKGPSHESLHQSGISDKCTGCHKGSLIQEHTNNTITNPGKNYTCDTCHKSTSQPVQRTIGASSLNCSGCHTQGHQLAFGDKVATDIPVYQGFKWSTPVEGEIVKGDSNAPTGYENGQLVISNRRTDVTVAAIWVYYQSEFAAQGWQLSAVIPEQPLEGFSAEFTKTTRAVTVKCYKTQERDGSGGINDHGYRVEVWMK